MRCCSKAKSDLKLAQHHEATVNDAGQCMALAYDRFRPIVVTSGIEQYHPMNLGKVIVSAKAATALLIVSLLQWPVPVEAAPVTTEKAACDVTKTSIAARDHFPVSLIAFCDMVAADSSPHDYYVLALHSTRKCDGICSTNMGWFAVEKATGRVFEWDMAEDKLGPPVKFRP